MQTFLHYIELTVELTCLFHKFKGLLSKNVSAKVKTQCETSGISERHLYEELLSRGHKVYNIKCTSIRSNFLPINGNSTSKRTIILSVF